MTQPGPGPAALGCQTKTVWLHWHLQHPAQAETVWQPMPTISVTPGIAELHSAFRFCRGLGSRNPGGREGVRVPFLFKTLSIAPSSTDFPARSRSAAALRGLRRNIKRFNPRACARGYVMSSPAGVQECVRTLCGTVATVPNTAAQAAMSEPHDTTRTRACSPGVPDQDGLATLASATSRPGRDGLATNADDIGYPWDRRVVLANCLGSPSCTRHSGSVGGRVLVTQAVVKAYVCHSYLRRSPLLPVPRTSQRVPGVSPPCGGSVVILNASIHGLAPVAT
jgi:hypothetical protein